jgi:hypothetical protein
MQARKPASDLQIAEVREMPGGFQCRPGHPLLQSEGGVSFDDLRRYPIASTPLSVEVGRALIARYGPQADPWQFVTLSCEEVASLAEVGRQTNAIVFAIWRPHPTSCHCRSIPTGTARRGTHW